MSYTLYMVYTLFMVYTLYMVYTSFMVNTLCKLYTLCIVYMIYNATLRATNNFASLSYSYPKSFPTQKIDYSVP